jgi:hypothetical protein
MFSDPNGFTPPLGVASVQSQYTHDVAHLLTHTTMSTLPALMFFILGVRRIIGGVTGSVKGCSRIELWADRDLEHLLGRPGVPLLALRGQRAAGRKQLDGLR